MSNREAMLTKLAELEAEVAKAVAGGGAKYVERHHARGKLLPRERIELLVDEGSAFLELSPLAGWGSDFTVGASVVTGIGVVEGVECLITANDPTVKGGASNPWTLKKVFRAAQIAQENNLPTISLVESGGADLPTQKEIFIPGGRLFRDLTRASARRQPTIALVFGNSTAGGAYVPGMSDYTVLVKEQAKVFLGGPPLVKMATGEESDDESLGGAEMHARVSGLADYLALDEYDALRIGRRIVARLNWRKPAPLVEEVAQRPSRDPVLPKGLVTGASAPSSTSGGFNEPDADPDGLLDLIPEDLREPFDPREVIVRICDGTGPGNARPFDEFKPLYGTSLVTGWARLHGRQIGILANAQGVLFSEEAQKATQFIQLANQIDCPLLFLHNTTGYMVGAAYEQGGIIKHGAQMINAVSNSAVPHLTVIMGASYGAGNYGMNGRAYDPRFLFTWPSAKSAVMGPAQLAGVLSIVARSAAEARGQEYDEAGDAGMRAFVEQSVEEQSLPYFLSGMLYDDGVIDPRDTRTVLAICLSVIENAPIRGAEGYGVFRDEGLDKLDRRWSAMMRRLLVANRAEIASRVFRTCRRLGIETVAVHSDADAGLPYVREADVAVRLPGTSAADTYLRIDLLLDAATRAGADAVHPGYGFLSENADFARAVEAAGLTWVGPAPESIEAMGSKIEAKRIIRQAGVPVLEAPVDPAEADLPLLVKASAGGGGRGMRVVRRLSELAAELAEAEAEALSAFGDGTVFVEPYVERGRHVEVQVFGSMVLGERDCSIQRRHQKVVEEAPAPLLPTATRDALHAAARQAAEAIAYRGAGTVEFLYDQESDRFWFLEMNTRLQVEHPVTEAVLGIDLVELQLQAAETGVVSRLAALAPQPPRGEGHAIEVRLYAEDPGADHQPQSGVLTRFEIPAGEGIRIDAGYESGSTVSTFYDAMLAKVICHAPTREAAARKLADTLARARIHGVVTNRDQLVAVLRSEAFLAGEVSTAFLPEMVSTSSTGAGFAHAVAGAIALAEQAGAERTVQRGVPIGWRNVPSQPQRTTFEDGTVVGWWRGRDGYVVDECSVVEVRGAPATSLETTWQVTLEADGVRTTYDVTIAGDQVDVDGPTGHARLVRKPRFTDPADAVASGSLLAPMPGTVVSVVVAKGDEVAAGQAVLVLEAMKMQHTVAAPYDGVVTQVDVHAGQQVAAGEILAVVEESG